MDVSHQQIVIHEPEWVERYAAEAERLKPVFGGSLLGIEHIGSTSVPGLVAKPIVDIAVLIKSHTEADRFIESLAELGYFFDKEWHDKIESPERHFFRKGTPTRFHLSIAYGDKARFWPRQLLFRDYLRTHPEEREMYGKLKAELLKQDPSGGEKYIAGKSSFIQDMLQKAGFH